jgi:hypothetical protein
MKIGEVAYPHIVNKDDESARLENHPRTRVAMLVADYLWRGWSAEEIVRHYSYLTLAEVHAALASTSITAKQLIRNCWRKAVVQTPGARRTPLHQS